MGKGRTAAPDQHGEPPTRIQRRSASSAASGWRRFGGVALVWYAIVAVFGVTYAIVQRVSPNGSVQTAVIWGILASGPLALAFVWERLTGLKFFGVEVTLAQAVILPDRTLDIALSASEPEQQYFSGNEAIWRLIDRVVGNGNIELLEINLRSTQYWWSTRLYLQGALVDDYTSIQRLVFVEGDTQRRYVGMASPCEIRKAFAEAQGVDLELAYREIVREIRESPDQQDHIDIRRIVEKWAAHTFGDDKSRVEEVIKTAMPAELLTTLVKLERESVEWDQPLDSALLQALVLEKAVPFVPLLQSGQLVRVVKADLFARQMATQTLRAKLR
jgi:hypothetical protein